MDAVPIVPPLFWGTKNTTLHELQTGDRSRATDRRLVRPCQSRALHLVSAPFGDPFSGPGQDAVVAQLVRAPVCGTGGRWFEPTQLYQRPSRVPLPQQIIEAVFPSHRHGERG